MKRERRSTHQGEANLRGERDCQRRRRAKGLAKRTHEDATERRHLVTPLVHTPHIPNGTRRVRHGSRRCKSGEETAHNERFDVHRDGTGDGEDAEEAHRDEVDDAPTVHWDRWRCQRQFRDESRRDSLSDSGAKNRGPNPNPTTKRQTVRLII
jgi:hypothetical protein